MRRKPKFLSKQNIQNICVSNAIHFCHFTFQFDPSSSKRNISTKLSQINIEAKEIEKAKGGTVEEIVGERM
jgi:hypothetical protein